MKFEYYVLNYDWNKNKVERFNIFRNCHISEWTEKAVKKYLRAPSKYKYIVQYKNEYLNREEIAVYGFEALCREIKTILMNQLWSRRQYEISVSDAFVYEIRDIVANIDKYETLEDLKNEILKQNEHNPKLEKWDCFDQCEYNIPIIAREVIYQYKEQLKRKKEDDNG